MNLSGLKASPKPEGGVEDKAYAAWIAKLPSMADGAKDVRGSVNGPIYGCDGHHIRTEGAGHGDYWRIPLTHKQHMLCHSKGNKFVEEKYGIDFHACVCKLLRLKLKMEIPDRNDWVRSAELMVEEAEKRFRNDK